MLQASSTCRHQLYDHSGKRMHLKLELLGQSVAAVPVISLVDQITCSSCQDEVFYCYAFVLASGGHHRRPHPSLPHGCVLSIVFFMNTEC